MQQDSEKRELLKRVQGWFNAPEQVHHYQQEAPAGPTTSEQWLLETLPLGGHILDIGCGSGRITIELARRGFDVIGIDVSEELLETATTLARDVQPAPTFQLVEALSLPFEDDRFDAALCFN